MYKRALLTPAIFLIPALPTFLLATLVLLSIAVPLPWMGEVAVAPGQESAVGPIPTPWCSCRCRGWPRPLGSPVAEPAALPFVAPFLLPVPAGHPIYVLLSSTCRPSNLYTTFQYLLAFLAGAIGIVEKKVILSIPIK